MRNLILAGVAALVTFFSGSAVAAIYECMNQFGDKVFSNVEPSRPRWQCADPSSPIGRKSFFEKRNDECVSEVLSSCRVLDIGPLQINPEFVALSCIIDNAVAPDFRGTAMAVQYNEQRNAAIVNDHQATHVSITATTLLFRWGSPQGTITIDRFSGRFRIGNDKDPVLASGRCDRVTKPRF